MATAIKVNTKELRTIVRGAVREELREFFVDPDFGLELRDSVVKRIRKSQRSQRAGRVHTAEEVIKKLGLGV